MFYGSNISSATLEFNNKEGHDLKINFIWTVPRYETVEVGSSTNKNQANPRNQFRSKELQ